MRSWEDLLVTARNQQTVSEKKESHFCESLLKHTRQEVCKISLRHPVRLKSKRAQSKSNGAVSKAPAANLKGRPRVKDAVTRPPKRMTTTD